MQSKPSPNCRQATVRSGQSPEGAVSPAEYSPFEYIRDLPCWPSHPLYDQLVEGDALRSQDIDLESFWTPWKNVETRTLRRGVDFDLVVCGISVGALPYITPELMAANPKWKAMCEGVGTVATMSMQWWLKPDLNELGWDQTSPVMDAYVEPMNTWADMSLLLKWENWDGDSPKNISYFCGPMVAGIPNPDDHAFPAWAYDDVKKAGLDFANHDTGFLWPRATPPDNPNGFNFDDFCGGFDGQYYRANINPTERYVMSLKGSVDFRLRQGESGFSNLFLAGDWTYNYFNAGCVEATVASGMLCSNAITGFPAIKDIEGILPGKWWT